jgi:alpha-D-xyloside xylohydrolase
VSSRGYGILWDNTSFTRFGDLTDSVPLAGRDRPLRDGGRMGDVNPGQRQRELEWHGHAPVTGDYTFRTYSSGTIQLQVNGKLVIDHWRQNWLPNEDSPHVADRRPSGAGEACNGPPTAPSTS